MKRMRKEREHPKTEWAGMTDWVEAIGGGAEMARGRGKVGVEEKRRAVGTFFEGHMLIGVAQKGDNFGA